MAQAKNQKTRVLALLQKRPLTSSELTARAGIANPRSVIHRLRVDGYYITTDFVTTKKGQSVRQYTLS